METTLPLQARFWATTHVRWLRRFAWLGAILAAAVGLRLTLLRPSAVPVTVFRVAAGRVEETVTNSRAGTVKSRRRATLSSEIGGRVAELPVKKGARVKSGDVLMRIADADYRAQLLVKSSAVDAARSARTEACLQAELATRELARN